jgi:hypothetical protein
MTSMTTPRWHVFGARLTIASAALLVLSGCVARTSTPGRSRVVRTGGAERRFPDPKAAVDALLAACRTDDSAALLAIFGDEAKPLVSTGDAGADQERCKRLVTAARQMTRLDPKGSDTLELVVGLDDWPFPIPLVKDAKGWRFDTVAGEQEILKRRVGADEIEAIAACRSYVRAQEAYASRPRDRGAKAYAQRIASTPGTHDGLYWPASGKGDQSPLGPMVAAAGEYAKGKRPAGSWWGYYFRILDAQGPAAPGSARSYLKDGVMTGGFALVAYPVEYGSTGIMTFLVGQDGRVYERDLGAKTDEIARAMTDYDPAPGWTVVTD